MASPLKTKLRTQAAADAGLIALLTSGPLFRWYDLQYVQGSGFPAVVAQIISNPNMQVVAGRMPTSWTRVQFTVWGGQFDAGDQACENVVAALKSFLQDFNGTGIIGLDAYPNEIVNIRDAACPQPDGMIFQKQMDVMIFSDESV